jgi:hypothetical protein
MRTLTRKSALIAMAAMLGGTAVAVAQPMGPGGGYGRGYSGMGPGMMGGSYGYSDPTTYLDGLKTELAITRSEEAAWDAYAGAVKAAADQMQGVRRSMWEAMGTSSWEERRDMMNEMFDVRQAAFDTVHNAAEKLLPKLTTMQQAKAAQSLPGLGEPGYRRGGPWR